MMFQVDGLATSMLCRGGGKANFQARAWFACIALRVGHSLVRTTVSRILGAVYALRFNVAKMHQPY